MTPYKTEKERQSNKWLKNRGIHLDKTEAKKIDSVKNTDVIDENISLRIL